MNTNSVFDNRSVYESKDGYVCVIKNIDNTGLLNNASQKILNVRVCNYLESNRGSRKNKQTCYDLDQAGMISVWFNNNRFYTDKEDSLFCLFDGVPLKERYCKVGVPLGRFHEIGVNLVKNEKTESIDGIVVSVCFENKSRELLSVDSTKTLLFNFPENMLCVLGKEGLLTTPQLQEKPLFTTPEEKIQKNVTNLKNCFVDDYSGDGLKEDKHTIDKNDKGQLPNLLNYCTHHYQGNNENTDFYTIKNNNDSFVLPDLHAVQDFNTDLKYIWTVGFKNATDTSCLGLNIIGYQKKIKNEGRRTYSLVYEDMSGNINNTLIQFTKDEDRVEIPLSQKLMIKIKKRQIEHSLSGSKNPIDLLEFYGCKLPLGLFGDFLGSTPIDSDIFLFDQRLFVIPKIKYLQRYLIESYRS